MREQREEWRKDIRELTPTERRFIFAFVKKKSLSAAYKLVLNAQPTSQRTAERVGSKFLARIRAKLLAIQEMRARLKKK